MTTSPTFTLFSEEQIDRVVKDDAANRLSGAAEQGVWLYMNEAQTGSKFGE